MLVARSPELFARPTRAIAGLPNGTLFPILEQAPRYLGWLAAQGYLGTTHPWIAVVAADLARRVRWRRCAPPRHCQLTPTDYTALLRERTTGIQLTITDGHIHATNAITGTLTTWTGRATHSAAVSGTTMTDCPAPHTGDGDNPSTGAAVFTKRGDHTATGWLADHYAEASKSDS